MIKDERIGQILLREGVITEEDLNKALDIQKESFGKALGEVLLELHMVEEIDFLRILAKKFKTQYLTTKKLSQINVPEAIIKLVPVDTAEKYTLFPVQYKKEGKSLTIVMVNPNDVAAVDEVKFVAGVSSLKCLIGMEESVQAAIKRWYKGEQNAFDMLTEVEDEFGDYGGEQSPSSRVEHLESEDSSLDLSALVSSTEDSVEESDEEERISISPQDDGDQVYLGGMDEMPGDNKQDNDEGIVIEDLAGNDSAAVEEVTVAPISHPEETAPVESAAPAEEEPADEKPARRTDVKKYRMRMLVMEPHDSIQRFIVKLFSHEGFTVRGVKTREEALEELGREEYDSLVIKDRDLGEGEEFAGMMAEKFPDVELCSIKGYGSALIGETRAQRRLMSSFLETIDILLGLLEMSGEGMQGHSHNVAKYVRLIASKLDLPQREVDTIALAAYVHDLGKKGIAHRSLLRIDENTDADELMELAQIPLKLLSSAKYPLEIAPVIRHQYERWNGKGLPDRKKAEEIPVGSRILALVETFEDLTNKFIGDEAMEPTAALEILKKHEGDLFDPDLVEIFLGLVKDDIYLQQMAESRELILVVDTEIDQLTILELRLISMGFAVSTARTGKEALGKAKNDKPSLIITEADLPDLSGFDMIEKLKADPETKDIHFVFLSKNDSSEAVTQGLQLGAEDYMTKPVKLDILGAKINTMMSRLKAEKKTAPAASGVTGSLSEMALPDIVQILGAGRKTGWINLEDNGKTAHIEMEEGTVANAIIDDLKGEDAFYKILYWTKGTFSIDPTGTVTERLINMSNDSLMLEGFRRMDEGVHGASEEDIALDGSDFF